MIATYMSYFIGDYLSSAYSIMFMVNQNHFIFCSINKALLSKPVGDNSTSTTSTLLLPSLTF